MEFYPIAKDGKLTQELQVHFHEYFLEGAYSFCMTGVGDSCKFKGVVKNVKYVKYGSQLYGFS